MGTNHNMHRSSRFGCSCPVLSHTFATLQLALDIYLAPCPLSLSPSSAPPLAAPRAKVFEYKCVVWGGGRLGGTRDTGSRGDAVGLTSLDAKFPPQKLIPSRISANHPHNRDAASLQGVGAEVTGAGCPPLSPCSQKAPPGQTPGPCLSHPVQGPPAGWGRPVLPPVSCWCFCLLRFSTTWCPCSGLGTR